MSSDDLYYDTSTGTRVLRVRERFPGARVAFEGNVLYCSVHRIFADNLAVCIQALALLTGLSVDELTNEDHAAYLKIEAYRSS